MSNNKVLLFRKSLAIISAILIFIFFFILLQRYRLSSVKENHILINDGSKIKESLREWWYFDGNLYDGTVLSVTWGVNGSFKDKILNYPVEVTILQPNGEKYSKRINFSPDNSSASLKNCDLKFGRNILKGKNGHYRMNLDLEDLKLDFELKRDSPLYTGKLFDNYFNRNWRVGWLVEVPRGEMVGKMTLNGVEKNIRGMGYHDHNWFDLDFSEYGKILDHRYWGRFFFDDYILIFNYNIGKKEYEAPLFESLYLARGDQVLIDYSQATGLGEKKSPLIIITRSGERIDSQTGMKIYDKLNLKYKVDNGIELELDSKNLGDMYSLASAEMGNQYIRYRAGAIIKIKEGEKAKIFEAKGIAEFRD